MIRVLTCAALAVALAVPSAAAPPVRQNGDELAGLGWIKATGHRMEAPEPSPGDLAPLVAKLSGARIIGIGEVNHGTHQDQAFKATLIKELVKSGAVRVFAIEANRAAGADFDGYVRKGEGDPAAAVMSGSFFRIWKGDEFAGLILWLRAWNRAHPDDMVRIIGIDNQDAGRDAELALGYLAKHDPAKAARLKPAFGGLIVPPGEKYPNPSAWIQASKPGELPAALAAAIELRDVLASHAKDWGSDPDYAEAAYAARIAWQNLFEYEREVGVVDLSTLPLDYWSRRDVFMAENLPALLQPGERAAFWAHDGHIMDEVSPDLAKKGFTTVGTEIEKKLGADYRTVGFTYSKAVVLTQKVSGYALDYNKRTPDEPVPLANDRAQDLGGALAKLPGNAWWFAVDAPPTSPAVRRWLAKPLWRGYTGASIDPAKFQQDPAESENYIPVTMGFDVLVWFRTMTPQQRWPALPPKP